VAEGRAARCCLALIASYRRHASPIPDHDCRYRPSCSRYAELAIAELGALRGGWRALKRILRCTPSASGGYDPPPRRGRGPAPRSMLSR
jgi:putative membrane protein insertion efficiency factor